MVTVTKKAVYPVYSYLVFVAFCASLTLARHIYVKTGLYMALAALPVHIAALVWVCLPKVSESDGAASIVAQMWQHPQDDELQLQACRALVKLTARGADTESRAHAKEANQHRGAEAVLAALKAFPEQDMLATWGVEALLRLVAERKEHAAKLAPEVVPVVIEAIQQHSGRGRLVARLCVLAGRVLDGDGELAISTGQALQLVTAVDDALVRHSDDNFVQTHACYALLVLAAARASDTVKATVASTCLGHVADAMQRFPAEGLLCSYGVVLVAACIKGAQRNWRAVFQSGMLARVAQAVEDHPTDEQIAGFGPQLLALSKSQAVRGEDVVMMDSSSDGHGVRVEDIDDIDAAADGDSDGVGERKGSVAADDEGAATASSDNSDDGADTDASTGPMEAAGQDDGEDHPASQLRRRHATGASGDGLQER